MTYRPTPTDLSLEAVNKEIDKQLARQDIVTLTRGQIEALRAPKPETEE